MTAPFQIRLLNGKQFSAAEGQSLLDSAAQAGLALEHSCRTGRCGACKTRVTSGTVKNLLPTNCLSLAERQAGWVLTCASSPASDMELEAEDLGLLADIKLLTVPARIDSLESLGADVLRVRLRLPPNHGFRYLPGQYVNIQGPSALKRPYSIANAPQADGKLEFHIRRVGSGAMSQYWFEQAKLNDLLRFEGPRGTFFLRPIAGRSLVLMATGTGFAPIQALLQQISASPQEDQPRDITVLWGGRKPEDFYVPAVPWPSQLAPLRWIPVLSRPGPDWQGASGYVQNVFLEQAGELGNTWVYACGSDAMITSAKLALLEAGLPARQFLSDAFVAA